MTGLSNEPETVAGIKSAELGNVNKREYAAHWGVSKRTIDALLARGLPHIKFSSRLVRIPIVEADRWIAENHRTQRRAVIKQGVER